MINLEEKRIGYKERKSLTAAALEGVDVDNTSCSLVKSADVLWIENAFKLHKQGKCIDLFKPYVIGRQFLASDRTMFLSVATCWDLLGIFRSLAAGYLVQLQCDVTSKASTAARNKLGCSAAAPLLREYARRKFCSMAVHFDSSRDRV